MILVVLKAKLRAKYVDEFPTFIAKFAEATRAEPGNICFDWYRNIEDPNEFTCVEAFVDRAAGDLHVQAPHFQEAMGDLGRFFASVPEIVNVEVPEGWSTMSEV